MLRSELIVQANGVKLCAETFGDRCDPLILLIMGAGASMDWWEDELCERLAEGSRFVVRYDHRDTGRSVTYPAGSPPYTGGDLAADVIGLLDAFNADIAHLVGMSMGGAIAQVVALDHPERVATLTLISTSLADRDRAHLPSMTEETAARFDFAEPDWSDRSAAIDYLVAVERICSSPSADFDEAGRRRVAGRAHDRSSDMGAGFTTTTCSTMASRPPAASGTFRFRRWSSTGPTIRFSPSTTAAHCPRRFPGRGCSPWSGPATSFRAGPGT